RSFTNAQSATIAGNPVALVANMKARPVAGLIPRSMRPETNGMAAKLLRETGMPIATASGTANGRPKVADRELSLERSTPQRANLAAGQGIAVREFWLDDVLAQQLLIQHCGQAS